MTAEFDLPFPHYRCPTCGKDLPLGEAQMTVTCADHTEHETAEFTVRTATPDDRAAIETICDRALGETDRRRRSARTFDVVDGRQPRGRGRRRARRPALARPCDRGEAIVVLLSVYPEHQGTGVGAALLEAADELAAVARPAASCASRSPTTTSRCSTSTSATGSPSTRCAVGEVADQFGSATAGLLGDSRPRRDPPAPRCLRRATRPTPRRERLHDPTRRLRAHALLARRAAPRCCCSPVARSAEQARRARSHRRDPGRRSSQPVKIGTLPTEDSLPLWVAEDMGYFATEGLTDVEIVTFQSAQERDAAFASGAIDAYMGDIIAAANLEAGGTPNTIETIMLGADQSQGRFGVVVPPEERTCKSLTELAGVPVGTSTRRRSRSTCSTGSWPRPACRRPRSRSKRSRRCRCASSC